MSDERLPWVAAVAASAADIVSTLAGLQSGLPEANPLAAAAFETVGALPAMGALTAVALLGVAAVWRVGRRYWGRRVAAAAPLTFASLQATFAIWNLAVLGVAA